MPVVFRSGWKSVASILQHRFIEYLYYIHLLNNRVVLPESPLSTVTSLLTETYERLLSRFSTGKSKIFPWGWMWEVPLNSQICTLPVQLVKEKVAPFQSQRLLACSRLQDSRVHKIEKARKQNYNERKLRRWRVPPPPFPTFSQGQIMHSYFHVLFTDVSCWNRLSGSSLL